MRMPTKVYAVLAIGAGAMTLQIISSANSIPLPVLSIDGITAPAAATAIMTASAQKSVTHAVPIKKHQIQLQSLNRRVYVDGMTLEYRSSEPFVLADNGRWLKVRK